ncbi:MAG TPA: SelB C-terminal domain-containing protein, partial [Rubrobacter sp.]|nr:SelB C-terminal domain-containing protein [Rubrobacter sp.]
PVVPVSGATGEGVEKLLEELDALAADPPDGRSAGLTRLPVDRAFVLKGIGVVVTGTLWSGEIRPGDALFTSSGQRPRVRSVQNHGHPAEVAYPGARTALDLVGIEISEIEAGDVLTSRPVPKSLAFDARLRLLEGAAPLSHGTRVRLHHGTRATNARVRLSGVGELAPGESVFARIRPEEPLVVLPGDRFVLRSLTPQITIGGGTVLDPAPSGRRPDPGWLAALEAGDLSGTIPLVLARHPERGLTAEEISLAVSAPVGEVRDAAEGLPGVLRVGDLYAPAGVIEEAKDRLLAALRARAEGAPEAPEISVADARSATGLQPALADALLDELANAEVRVTEDGVALPDATGVPETLEREAGVLLQKLEAAGAEPPATETSPALRLLLKRGEAVDLGGGLFASRRTADRVLEGIMTVCREEGEISLSGLRDSRGTSRKFAQAWLGFSDATGVTSRTGDVRVLTRRHRRAM